MITVIRPRTVTVVAAGGALLMSLLAGSAGVAVGDSERSSAGPRSVGAAVGEDPYLRPSGNGGYNVVQYRLKLKYGAQKRSIRSARMDVRARATQRLTRFSLDAGKGLRIQKVRVNGKRAKFRHSGQKLHIYRFGSVRPKAKLRTVITYRGRPRPKKDASGRGRFGWLRTPGGIVTYNEPDGTSTWAPVNDVFYDKAKWRMDVTTPSPLMAVSTGKLVAKRRTAAGGTRTVWRTSTPIQPYVQVLAIDRFSYRKGRIAGVPSFVAVAKGSGISVAKMTKRTRRAMKWLTRRLGKYPFPQTGAIVVSGGDSAMETAGRPTYSADRYYYSLATVVHELAHQWFGNRVTTRLAEGMWLHEGFATYLENVETAERRGWSLDNIVHGQYVTDGWGGGSHRQFRSVPLADPTRRYLLNTTPYFRGQAAVHALRAEVGDARFWSAVRKLADQPPGRTITTAAAVRNLERSTGRDLSAWARTWLFSTGYQALPKPPGHKQVVRELGPEMLVAASDWSWWGRKRESAATGLRRAIRGYSPNNHLVIDGTRSVGKGKKKRFYVDFSTRSSPLYPRRYASCLVFRPSSGTIRYGDPDRIRFSTGFRTNTFTTKPCPKG